MALTAITTGATAALRNKKIRRYGGRALTEIGGLVGVGGGGKLGPGPEQTKGWPAQAPTSKRRDLGVAGRAFKHEGFGGASLTLYPGRYDFDDLNAAGLHDEITTMKVRPGYTVIVYAGVEGGKPAGKSKRFTGPAQVDFEQIGWNDVISSIAVLPKQSDRQRIGQGGSRPPMQAGGGTGVGTPGITGGNFRSPTGGAGGGGVTVPQQDGGIFAQITRSPVLLLGIFAGIILWIANQ